MTRAVNDRNANVTTPSDREIRIERIFEWDGMPGHVTVETMTLEDSATGAPSS